MKRIVHSSLWYVLVIFAAANGVLALRYLLPHVPFAAPLPNFKLHRFALAIHASCGGFALLVGPFQISEGSRIRFPRYHRTAGWVYVVAVGLAAIAAIVMVPHVHFGLIAGSGFLTLAIVWLLATGTALRMAIMHRFQDHRRWMLRSYALTAAAITLRILLPAFAAIGLPAGPSYRAIAWMCWLLNLAAVEAYLFFRGVTSLPLQRIGKTQAV